MSSSVRVNDVFKVDSNGVPFIKMVLWGPSLAGKTSLLTVYNVLRKVEDPETIYSALKKIDDPSGRTIFYDQSTFELPKGQGTSLPTLRYQLWTVAGQERHHVQRKIVLKGADGVLLLLDSSKDQWEHNVASLEELIKLKEDDLKSGKLPFLIVLNKSDMPSEDRSPTMDFINLLVQKGIVKDVGTAYLRIIETSCLKARDDLISKLRDPERASFLDENGHLKKGERPLSVRKVAQPIEQLTREIVVNRIKNAQKQAPES